MCHSFIIWTYFLTSHNMAVSTSLYFNWFLGMFAKLRKANISFVMYVCPSAWKNGASTGWIVMKLILEYFLKICLAHACFSKI